MRPTQLTHLPALKYLRMSTNRVGNLSIGHLPLLEELRANWCELETFPNLAGAPNLTTVVLKNNKYDHIPSSAVSGLAKLKLLWVSGNGIRYLPDLSHLVSLEDLDIAKNALTSLPDLYHLPLTRVTWRDNPLICNTTLCWLRMWSSMKPGIMELENGLCAAPKAISLMGVHPVDMKCYDGKYFAL